MRVNTNGIPVVKGCGFIDDKNDVVIKLEGRSLVGTRYSGLMVIHIIGALSASDMQKNVRLISGRYNIAIMKKGRFADGSDMPQAGFYLAYYNSNSMSVTLV